MQNPQKENSRELFLSACEGRPTQRPPFWIMRQAGRYLPEYRKLKEKYGFLGIVKNPQIAVEAALQPMRRFGFDCAIAFSDILTIPESLGFAYRFKDGGGIELLRTVDSVADVEIDSPKARVHENLAYVAENIKILRGELPQKALFGFCGAPFTLAAYMVEGGGSKTFDKFRTFVKSEPTAFAKLMDSICDAAIEYAKMQAECSIDAFQIFDSNAALIDNGKYYEMSGKWNAKICAALKGRAKTFLFAPLPVARFGEVLLARADAYSIYTGNDLTQIRRENKGDYALQGNLDPALLSSATTAEVVEAAAAIIDSQKFFGRHIFNLGHGILPDAKIQNVEALCQCVKERKSFL